jgi:hypothetical protein
MVVAPCCGALPGVGHHGGALGRPVPRAGRGWHGRSQLTSRSQPTSNADAHRAAHHWRTGHPALGRCSHRLSAWDASLHVAPRAHSLWAGSTAVAGSPYRAGDPPHGTARVRGDDPPRRQEARQDPAGGGWRMVGRAVGKRNAQADKSVGSTDQGRHPVRGYHFLHTAIDGTPGWPTASCLPTNAKRPPLRSGCARAWFDECGITVRKVLTATAPVTAPTPFADAVGDIEHRRTRPYRPQTNGKVCEDLDPDRRMSARPGSTPATPNGAPGTPPGHTPTITTAATPHSAAKHPPPAYLT